MIGMLGALAAIQGEPRLDDTSVVPPLDRMAALPQAFIMQQAQKGQIPKEMVAPILAKKAENAQAAAMQNAAFKQAAMQGGPVPPSTVIEGIIAKNAQAEVGIPTVAGNNVSNPAFMRSGGIVAFGGDGEDESYVDFEKIKKRLADMENMGPRDVSLAPVRDKDKPSIDFNPALLPEGISAGEIPYEGGSEGDKVAARVKEILDLRKQTLGDAPKMDTSPEITGRDLAFAGLQAAVNMGQGPNFLSNVLEGGKAGVASLTKTPQDRAAAEFKAKQTEYLAKSGAVNEALKTVGKRADIQQEQDYKAGESVKDRGLKTTLSADQIRSNELIASKKLSNALQISKGQNLTNKQVANIKANAAPELVKIANNLGMSGLKPTDPGYAKKAADFLRQAADLTGKFSAEKAAKIGLIKESVKGANKIMEQQFGIGGLGRHLLMASAAYDTLTEKQKTDIDNAIDKYNAKPENKDNQISAKGEQGAREMFDRVYLKGFNALQRSTLDSLGLTSELVKELMGPSGSTTVESERDFNDLKKEPEK